MDVVANLLPLVAEDGVAAPLEIALHEVAEKPVQFHARMARAGQASAAEAAGRHAEVAAILLHHDVAGHLRCPEQRMFAGIDPKCFADAIPVGGIGVVPAGREFHHRQFVGGVAVNLVGAHVHKRRFLARPTHCLEEIQRADGIRVEVVKRNRRGTIMRWLGCRVDNGVRTNRVNKSQHAIPIADVEFMVDKAWQCLDQSLLVPPRVAGGAKEDRPLVVVDAMDLPSQGVEMRDDLAADEPRGTSNEQFAFHEEDGSFRVGEAENFSSGSTLLDDGNRALRAPADPRAS